MTKYEILENNKGVLKTVITQELEIDLAQTVKNITQTRAEFQKAWATLYEMSKAMDSYVLQHKAQNEFLDVVEEFTGEKLQKEELVNPFNTDEILKGLEEFMNTEKERREKSLEQFKNDEKVNP
ncbi:MAG TPA: hypothetical protein PLP73_00085 [Candidatus Absconditabacterales bacterium]|nr:hypothetical protein [Candidatus Absconditabacterales bacterium]